MGTMAFATEADVATAPTFKVVFSEVENGEISLEKEEYEAGETVNITVVANEGFVLEGLSAYETKDIANEVVNIFSDKKVKIENNSFMMPASDVRVIANFIEAESNDSPVNPVGTPTPAPTVPASPDKEDMPETSLVSIMPFSVGAVNTYITARNNGGPSTNGAISFKEGEIPSGYDPAYSGYIVRSTSTPNISYSTTVTGDDGNPAYYMPNMTSYKEGGSNNGKLYTTYPKALIYKGKEYDIRITINDWEVQSNKTVSTTVNPAVVRFQSTRPGLYVNRMNSVEFFMEFFEAGTTTTASVKGYATFKDIDYQQGIVFKSGWQKFYIGSQARYNIDYVKTNSGNDYFYDNYPTATGGGSTNNDISRWMMATFSGSLIKTTYTFMNSNYSTLTTPNWILSTNSADGSMIFDSEKLYPGPVEIEKRVSDDNEKLVTSNTLSRSPSPRRENFLYTLDVTVPGENVDNTYYKNFEIRDEIDSGLEIDRAGITIYDQGTNRTSWFDISVDSNNVLRIKAKAENLLRSDFYECIYTVNIPVKIKDSTDLIPYIDAATNKPKIPNKAQVIYDGGTVDSNFVYTYVPQILAERGRVEITKVGNSDSSKKLSGVVFNVYEWSESVKGYKTAIYDTLYEDSDRGNLGLYLNSKPYIYTEDNKFKFKIVETASIPHYVNSGWSKEIQLTGSETNMVKYTVENEQMDPRVLIAKKADKTTNAVLENGKYIGDKDAGMYYPDQKVDYTITTTNAGNLPIKNIVIKDLMDEKLLPYVLEAKYNLEVGQEIETVKGNKATVVALDDDTVTLDKLAVGDSVDVHYIATLVDISKFAVEESLNNVATVQATYETGEGDGEVPGDDDDDDIILGFPEVKIAKKADKTTNVSLFAGKYVDDKIAGVYYPDQTIDYTLTATNTGNVNLVNVVITEEMSAELKAYVKEAKFDFEVGQEIITTNENTVTVIAIEENVLTLDGLLVGDSVEVHYLATLVGIEDFGAKEALSNVVKVNANYPTEDGDGEVPGDEDDDEVIPEYADVKIAKVADKTTDAQLVDGRYEGKKEAGTYESSQVIDFKLTVTNNGTATLNNLVITEEMSKELKKYVKESSFDAKVGQEVKTTNGNIATVIAIKGDVLTLDTLLSGDSVEIHYLATLVDEAKLKDENDLNNVAKVTAEFEKDGEHVQVAEDDEDIDEDDVKTKVKENEAKEDDPEANSNSPSGSVKTGDDTRAALLIFMAAVALIVIGIVLLERESARKR